MAADRAARPSPHLLGWMLAVATAAMLSGCGTPRYSIDSDPSARRSVQAPRPRYPVDDRAAGPSSTQRGAASRSNRDGDDDEPRISPSGSVSSRPLSGQKRGAAVAAAPPTLSPSPYAEGRARPPVLSSPSRVTVQQGESVFDIAERFRTPVRALIEANDLQPPYALTPGAVLMIPPPLVYTVQEGDTLFGIARRFNIDPRSLANLNDMAMETQLSRGRAVALPSLARDQGSNAQAGGPSPVGSTLGRAGVAGPGLRGEAAANAATPSSPTPRTTRLQPKTAADAKAAVAVAAARAPSVASNTLAAAGPVTDAQVAAAGRGRFVAPIRGEVISGFGVKGPGQRNDGVNIAAAQGSPVKAAAAGEVVYAGSAIPGFGNLVLVKHAGGWVTAYAHLDSIGVKMRAAVGQGDVVGTVGQSGGVDRPQLHFEIRYPPEPEASAKPIDPSLLLPGLR